MKKIFLNIFLIAIASTIVLVSCDDDKIQELNADFTYFLVGDESNAEPDLVYVGQTIQFKTKDVSGAEQMAIWVGDDGHNYDAEPSTNDTSLAENFNVGALMDKTVSEDGAETYFSYTYAYTKSSPAEGFKVYVIASADAKNASERASEKQSVNIIVKDTAAAMISFSLNYLEPSGIKKGVVTTKDREAQGKYSNDTIYCSIPYGIDVTALTAKYNAGNSIVTVGSVEPVEQVSSNADDGIPTSNDYSDVVKFVVTAVQGGASNTYKVVRTYDTDDTKTISNVKVGSYATSVNNVSGDIIITIPSGVTSLGTVTFTGIKGNIVKYGTDIIKEYYETSFDKVIDMNNSSEAITVFSKDGTSLDYTFTYVEQDVSISNISLSEIPPYDATPVFDNDLTYTFNVSPTFLASVNSKMTPMFDVDSYSTVMAYGADTVQVISGETSISFSQPVKFVADNGYEKDSIIVEVTTY